MKTEHEVNLDRTKLIMLHGVT